MGARDVVLAMMTTLDGRVDDPGSWVTGVDNAQYRAIEEQYQLFDAILVGSTTYAEMAEYWPTALTDDAGYAGADARTNQRMAELMRDATKYVISRTEATGELPWVNSTAVAAPSDDDLVRFVAELKARPGGDIHLAGGASLAQACVRLGLVDRFRLMVYPTASEGPRWFDRAEHVPSLELVGTEGYPNGVVLLDYRPTAPPA